jgi:hypothetical protein
MKKLAASAVIAGALVAGLASPASAIEPGIATLQCTIFFGTSQQTVFGFQASGTPAVTTPAVCQSGQNCTDCLNFLTSVPAPNTWFLVGSTTGLTATTGYAGPYFTLQRF